LDYVIQAVNINTGYSPEYRHTNQATFGFIDGHADKLGYPAAITITHWDLL
jgi:prepilin-type processing-associated H-X9-DG protein